MLGVDLVFKNVQNWHYGKGEFSFKVVSSRQSLWAAIKSAWGWGCEDFKEKSFCASEDEK